MSHKVNINEKFGLFSDQWSPKIVANVDQYDIRLVKIEGAFEWHAHADADEMFMVVEGCFDMQFRDRVESLQAGELIVVPKGMEHRPVADHGEAKVIIFEQSSVMNTGDGELTDRSATDMDRI